MKQFIFTTGSLMPNNKIATENLEKEKQQQKQVQTQKEAAEKAKPKCKVCKKYLFESPRCTCVGGGGGSGGGDAEERAGKEDSTVLIKTMGQIDIETHIADISIQAITGDILEQLSKQLSDDTNFNHEVISELLSSKLLVIDNDREKGILTIQLQCDSNNLSPEQRNELKKFLRAILNELHDFKKENNLSAQCYTIEQENNGKLSLRIMLPIPTLYDAFIERLAKQYLLPIQNIEQQPGEKVLYPEGVNHFNPNPFSTKLTRSQNRNIKSIQHEEEVSQTNKQSSIRPKSPLDGLKR